MKWYDLIRETGLREHVCEHGVGHPNFESAARVARKYNHDTDTWLAHGCDGCCGRDDFPGREPELGA